MNSSSYSTLRLLHGPQTSISLQHPRPAILSTNSALKWDKIIQTTSKTVVALTVINGLLTKLNFVLPQPHCARFFPLGLFTVQGSRTAPASEERDCGRGHWVRPLGLGRSQVEKPGAKGAVRMWVEVNGDDDGSDDKKKSLAPPVRLPADRAAKSFLLSVRQRETYLRTNSSNLIGTCLSSLQSSSVTAVPLETLSDLGKPVLRCPLHG